MARATCVEPGVPIGVSVTSTADAHSALEVGHRIARLADEMEAVCELVGDRHAAVEGGGRRARTPEAPAEGPIQGGEVRERTTWTQCTSPVAV